MELFFAQVGRPLDPSFVSRMRSCKPEYLFQTLIAEWAKGWQKQIHIFGLIYRGKKYPVMVALQEGEEQVAILQFSRKQFRELCGGHQPFPERVYELADSDGAVVDGEWFDRRNAKLKIGIDKQLDEIVAPAASIPQLLSCYALSSAGDIRIRRELVGDASYRPVPCYRLEMCFHGTEDTQYEWREIIFVREDRLQRFLHRRSSTS
ncbi:MAG: hypothetical protein U0136_12965 [Bdellovibrionota bacterium]